MSIPIIDFGALGVTAITRGLTLGETVVRHGVSDKFFFRCSNEEHDILANDFKRYLDRNKVLNKGSVDTEPKHKGVEWRI